MRRVKARDAFIGFGFAADVGGEHGPPSTSEPPEYRFRQDVQGLVTATLGSSLVRPKPPMEPLQKIPWRLSRHQKARQRKRLRAVDRVVDTLSAALRRNGQSTKAIDRWYAEMPREEEMLPKDKYTLFDKKEKTYRKGIHKLPKWTRVSQRLNPPGF
ncbi:hypothetical protein LV157_001456 [Aspergillus fumigatus]|nr:hypothetical protein LV157_001456 [Aspergillus fumigatus]